MFGRLKIGVKRKVAELEKPINKKPAVFGGLWLAVDSSPSLERFVIFGFPVRQLWENRKVRLNIEAEKRSVSEHDSD